MYNRFVPDEYYVRTKKKVELYRVWIQFIYLRFSSSITAPLKPITQECSPTLVAKKFILAFINMASSSLYSSIEDRFVFNGNICNKACFVLWFHTSVLILSMLCKKLILKFCISWAARYKIQQGTTYMLDIQWRVNVLPSINNPFFDEYYVLVR